MTLSYQVSNFHVSLNTVRFVETDIQELTLKQLR